MAEVHEGLYSGAAGFTRPVCIKRILPHAATDPDFREMFVKEAKLTGRLNHSNLVQVFDCLEYGDDLTLVMELVDGGDLMELIEAREAEPLPAELVAYIAGEVLEGLAYAHERKIIHRDISPHNILLSRHGEVKITDFGIAKALVTHATMTGKLKGKLAYMSPEQLGAANIDYRTDLYSLGLVLYELLTGERFFEKTTQSRLIKLITEAQRPKLLGVDTALARAVERLLEPEPELRYSSAEEAMAALPPWRSIGPLGARELGRLVRRARSESSSEKPDPSKIEPTERVYETTDVLPREGDIEPERDDKPTLEMPAMTFDDPPEIPETVSMPFEEARHVAIRDTVEDSANSDVRPRDVYVSRSSERALARGRRDGRLLKLLLVVGALLLLLAFGIALGTLLPNWLQ